MYISPSLGEGATLIGFSGMRVPPPSVVNSWPKPNYVDPVTRGPALLIVNIVLLVFSTIAVAGRLYSRIFIKRWFGVDDAMIIPAYVFAHGLTAVVILANLNDGWNRHEWDIPPRMFPAAMKISYAAKILFSLAATFIRLSLICFYYRLVKDSGMQWFRRVLHGCIAYTLAIGITFVLLAVLECSPIRAYWVYPPVGHCMNQGKLLFGTGIVNSFLDFLTMVLPIPIIWHLQMPLKQRIGVIILLSLGLIAAVAGVLRVYYTWKSLMSSYDTSWWAYPLWLSSAIEINLGLICACLPAWKALLQTKARKMPSTGGSGGSNRHQGSSSKPSLSAKLSTPKPLKSLFRFRMSRFDFQRTPKDESKDTYERYSPSEILLDPMKPEPALYFTQTHSIDQFSVHLQKTPHFQELQVQEPSAPSHWIRERSPRKQ